MISFADDSQSASPCEWMDSAPANPTLAFSHPDEQTVIANGRKSVIFRPDLVNPNAYFPRIDRVFTTNKSEPLGLYSVSTKDNIGAEGPGNIR
ncbi:hypothetical protein ACFL17_05025 [Pseudomonadota bacterium]